MKKLFYVLVFIFSLLIGQLTLQRPTQQAKAEEASTCQAIEVDKDANGHYLTYQKQNQLVNLFPSGDVISFTEAEVKLTTGLVLNKPTSNYLTFFFDYSVTDVAQILFLLGMSAAGSIGTAAIQIGILNYPSLTTNWSFKAITYKLDALISTSFDKVNFTALGSGLLIELDCSSFPSRFVLAGCKDYNGLSVSISTRGTTGNYTRSMLFDGRASSFVKANYQDPNYGILVCKSGPYMNNSVYNLTTNFDNPLTKDEIINHIYAYDYNDGLLEKEIVSDYYTPAINSKQLGKYSIILKATDSSNNASTFTILILIVDTTKPIINGPDLVTISYRNEETVSTLLDRYLVDDNHTKDITATIQNSETISFTTLGEKSLTITASDESQNITTKNITLKVIDDIAPEINGPTEISTAYHNPLTIDDLIALYDVNDEIDGTLPLTVIENNYTPNRYSNGVYSVIFKAIDTSGNEVTLTLNVTVIDTQSPIWFVDSIAINTTISNKLSALEIVNKMVANQYIERRNYIEAEFIEGRYLEMYNIVGSYQIKIKALTDADELVIVPLTINVVEDEKMKTPQKDFWSQVIAFFNNIFKAIGDFFNDIFKRLF